MNMKEKRKYTQMSAGPESMDSANHQLKASFKNCIYINVDRLFPVLIP
jgi:hypothetical protein